MTIETIRQMEGKRKTRTATERDLEVLHETIKEVPPETLQVRVYCGDWVPNSYKYRCPRTELIAYKNKDNDEWTITAVEGDAKRSMHKHHPYVTIQTPNGGWKRIR